MSVFQNSNGQDNPPGQPNASDSSTGGVNVNEQLANQLAAIKNDNGEQKYADVETALKALGDSQTYIQQLQTQKSELEAEVGKRSSVEEALAALAENQKGNHDPGSQLDETSVTELVQGILQQTKAQDTATANASAVNQALTAKYGEKAAETYAAKAKELGMSQEAMDSLASNSPQAVLAFFNTASSGQQSMVTGSQNTAGMEPHTESLVKRNENSFVGVSTAELRNESKASAEMVEELHKQGLTTWDLADPKNYAKYFK